MGSSILCSLRIRRPGGPSTMWLTKKTSMLRVLVILCCALWTRFKATVASIHERPLSLSMPRYSR